MSKPTNVISLPTRQPDQDLIDTLKLMLADAEAGEVVGGIGISSRRGDEQVMFMVGEIDMPTALGNLEILKYSILSDVPEFKPSGK